MRNYIKTEAYISNIYGRKFSSHILPKDKTYLTEILSIYQKLKQKLNYISSGALYEFRESINHTLKKLVCTQVDKIWQGALVKVN